MQLGAGPKSDNTFGIKIRDTIKSSDFILRNLGYFNFENFRDIEKRESFIYQGSNLK